MPGTVFAQGKPVELTGQVVEMHGDDFRRSREVDAGVFLKSHGKLYRLPDSAESHVGEKGTARGENRDGTVTLTEFAAAGGSSTSTGTSASTSTSLGVKRVAVIAFTFSDNKTQPFTTASVAQTYFSTTAGYKSVANYFNEVSWGQLQVTGQVFGWYTIPATSQSCDTATWATQADQAAQAAGVDLSGYGFKTYVFPGVSQCGWAGLGEMPGTRNWINGSPTVGVMTHELGHNFGLNHASSASCTLPNGDRVAFSSTCTASEYGDPYDVMGATSAANHVNEWHRAMLGLTGDIQTVSADGTYALTPVEQQSGSPHALRIPRGDGTYFDLEYRQPYGTFDAFTWASLAVTGVMIREVSSYTTANKPLLIDTTPETAFFSDAALTLGKTFVDPTTGISITTVALSSSGAQVQVKFSGGDVIPPTVSVATPTDGSSIAIPTTITVSATDNVGVVKVDLYRQLVGTDGAPGQLYGTDTAAPYTFSWADGQTGQYRFTAVAYDVSGLSSVSPAVTVNATQSDTSVPSTPTDFRSTGSTQTSIAMTWTPSTDNVGVAGYKLYRSGVEVGTASSSAYAFTGLTCGTSYTLSVAAFDPAGNLSTRKAFVGYTNACSGDVQSPTTPTGVQATASTPTSVQLSWQPSTDNVSVAGYRLERDGVALTRVSGTSYVDTSLTAGGTYRYTLTAYDASGNYSATSPPVQVTTPTSTSSDTVSPTTPTGLQATATSSTTVSIVWQPSTDNVAVAGYRVFRGGTQIVQTSSTSFTDSGLTASTTYSYTVAAYDAAGNVSSVSSAASVTTQSTTTTDTQPPTAPGNVTAAQVKGRKVSVAWAAASDNVGVTSYWVYRDGTRVAAVSGVGYTDAPTRGAHSYYVLAVDAAGNESASSNTATITL